MPVWVCLSGHGGGVLGGGAQAARKMSQRGEYLSQALKDEQEFFRQTNGKRPCKPTEQHAQMCDMCLGWQPVMSADQGTWRAAGAKRSSRAMSASCSCVSAPLGKSCHKGRLLVQAASHCSSTYLGFNDGLTKAGLQRLLLTSHKEVQRRSASQLCLGREGTWLCFCVFTLGTHEAPASCQPEHHATFIC